MIAQGWGRVVNITTQSVKAPIPQLGLSNAARAGLTGFVAGTSRQVAQYGVTINNLLPGIHATDRAIALDAGVVKARGHHAGGGARRTRGHHPGAALWHRGGVRRDLRVPVFASMPASSSGRTSCWMAGRPTRRCDRGLPCRAGRLLGQTRSNHLGYHGR